MNEIEMTQILMAEFEVINFIGRGIRVVPGSGGGYSLLRYIGPDWVGWSDARYEKWEIEGCWPSIWKRSEIALLLD